MDALHEWTRDLLSRTPRSSTPANGPKRYRVKVDGGAWDTPCTSFCVAAHTEAEAIDKAKHTAQRVGPWTDIMRDIEHQHWRAVELRP